MTKKKFILAFCGIYLISMSFSPAILSISMMGLAVAALIRFEPEGSWRPVWDIPAIKRLIRPWQQPSMAIIGVLFLIVLFSGALGGDLSYWLERLRVKLPLLVIPLMFIMFPHFTKREVAGFFYLLIIWMSLMALATGINYLLQADAINELIKQGKPMPTPGNHIRFSVLMAYAVISGGYLYGQGYSWKFKWERKLILGLSIFLFLFLHFLSVRSGLAALYLCMLVMGVRSAIITRKFWIGLLALGIILLMPLVAYYAVPSFRAKVEYMSYDRWMHRHEMGALYADSGRITSLKVGYQIFKEHPITGIGVGNMQGEVNKIFKTQYPDLPNPLMPHNQILYVLATTGLLGLLLFGIAFLFPLFYKQNYRHPMLLASYTIFGVMIMLEHNLENSGGIAFYTFFLCLLLNHLNNERPSA